MMHRRAHSLGVSALRTSRCTRFVVVPLTLVGLFSGCYKWSTPSQSPHAFIWSCPLSVDRFPFETQAAEARLLS